LGWERTFTILFIGAAILALLRVGGLASFVTQLGIAALVVSLLFIMFLPNLGKHAQWILVGVGLVVFYFGDYVTKGLNFKIQALDISADIGLQTPSLAMFAVLVGLAFVVGTRQNTDIKD